MSSTTKPTLDQLRSDISDCEHPNKTFVRTDPDWWDGDEEDVYDCNDCGVRFKVYIPR